MMVMLERFTDGMVVSGTDSREPSPLNIHDCLSLLLLRAFDEVTTALDGTNTRAGARLIFWIKAVPVAVGKCGGTATGSTRVGTNELLLDLSFDVLFREKARTALRRCVFLSFCFRFLSLRGLSAYFGTLALYTLTLPGYYITRANRPIGNGMDWELQ
jgi:hypothetical protein